MSPTASEISDEVLARQFRLHLHRGIAYLATPQMIRSISDLVKLADEDEGKTHDTVMTELDSGDRKDHSDGNG